MEKQSAPQGKQLPREQKQLPQNRKPQQSPRQQPQKAKPQQSPKPQPQKPRQSAAARKPIPEQMVDGIAGKKAPAASSEEQKRLEALRRRLAGRAAEALMFMDDEDEW